MQNEILRIEGKLVDLIPNTINRTIQINDLGNLESRESSYSQTIKLPQTSNNRKVFNFLGVSGNSSRAPYVNLLVDYIVDGIPLIRNGHAEVKATKEHYEVVIYDGIIDLADKLKNKTLSTLNYGDLNHFLSSQGYLDSMNNTEGYIYAVGSYMDNGLSPSKIERQAPSIFVHTMWDKIFSELGINYIGNFFTQNQDFKSEVITPPIGYEVQDVEPDYTPFGSYDTTRVFMSKSSPDLIFEANKLLDHNTTFIDSRVTFGGQGKIIMNETFQLQLAINLDYNSIEGYSTFRAVLNGQNIYATQLIDGDNTLEINLSLAVKPSDEIYFMIVGSDTGYNNNNAGLDKYRVSYSAEASISFSEASGGFLVDFSDIMGDMSQIDFLKDVMQRYGLIVKPNRTGDYEFIQYENLLNDREGAENWTKKLSTVDGEDYGIKYGKENIASYNYPKDITKPSHDGILKIDNYNSEAEKSLFKSPYEIADRARDFKSMPLYVHPIWEEKKEDGNTVIRPKESPIKIFRIKRKQGFLSMYYFNDSNAVTYSGEIPFLSLDNMSMQYFLNVYYKAFRLNINDYKEIDAHFNLNLMDVYDLDLFKLKYLKQTGKYYYLNKLQHNAGGKSSTGKLIEINTYSTNSPVEQLGSYTVNLSRNESRTIPITYLTTYSNPAYLDPENDSPFKVKFINGSNSKVKLYQSGVEITAGQEILVSDWDVTIGDLGTTTDAHSLTYEYQIMDEGSQSYGTQVGSLVASIYAYTNIPPVSNAGVDKVVRIDINQGFPILVSLDGSGSYDSNGFIDVYMWSIDSKPINSSAVITQNSNKYGAMNVPAERKNLGVYTIKLMVFDNLGLVDTDSVIITIDEDLMIPSN